MTTLQDLLNYIKDGAWHSLTEISKTLAVPIDNLIEICKSLSEQGLIKYDEKAKWVKVNPDWKPILSEEEIERAEHKPTVGTIIIPSKESITIQKVHISNTTDTDIELLLKICKESLELAISKIK